jgi:uncharacterized protein YndB with AHSA1/START domain
VAGDKFVYVTYIRTTPERLWDALTKPEFTQEYWAGTRQESAWTVGSSWKSFAPDGRLIDSGEIKEVDKPRRLVLTWRNELFPEMRSEGYSRLTYVLEPTGGDSVKLTLTHEIDVTGSKLLEAVSTGWPSLLASVKSLLETGRALAFTKEWPKDI